MTWIRAHGGARCQLDDSVRSRERQPADTAAVRQECSGDTCASMTTVREDGVDVVLDIAGIAPSALDAASASAVAASTPDAGVGSGAKSRTTLVIAECLRCEGNHNYAHTCGKKRARPQAAEAPARASRQRRQVAETADTRAALAVSAGAEDITAGASDSQPSPAIAQDVARPQDRHDSEAGRNGPVVAAAPPVQGADAVEPSGEEAGSDALEMAGARDELPQFKFAKLLKRVTEAPAVGSNEQQYKWLVEGTDGTQRTVEKCVVIKFSLKAAGDEPAWSCAHCTAKGWSADRALCCIECIR